jgi:hypothetical protein
VVTLLLVGIGVTGWAETTTTHFKINGDTAMASFAASDPDDSCIQNFATVLASDLVQQLTRKLITACCGPSTAVG